MFLKILFKNLFGYLNIKVEGFFVEKFFNKCIKENIFIWDIKRKNNTIIYMSVGLKDIRKIFKIAKEKKCKIKLIKKKGIPFKIRKYKKRKEIIVLFLIMIVILFEISNYLWNIQIEGLEKIEKEEIIKILEEYGIKKGVRKNKINLKQVIEEIRLNRKDIAWIGIDIKGINANISIKEAILKPDIIDENVSCNIIAKKDAQIIKISAQNGIPVVKENEFVKKGEILISGIISGKYTGNRFVHSNGKIIGKTWHKKVIKMPLEKKNEVRTGKKESKYKIKFNKFVINFNKPLSKFKKYDTIEMRKQVKIFSKIILPIEFIKIDNFEMVEQNIKYDIEEAKKIATDIASKEIEKEINNDFKLINKLKKFNLKENILEAEIIYEVLEDIGTKDKIVF